MVYCVLVFVCVCVCICMFMCMCVLSKIYICSHVHVARPMPVSAVVVACVNELWEEEVRFCCVPLCAPLSLPTAAQPILYWCSRNMSFWSSISFNLAVLMNLLVAFFYPLEGVRGGETTSGNYCFPFLLLFVVVFDCFLLGCDGEQLCKNCFPNAVVVCLLG